MFSFCCLFSVFFGVPVSFSSFFLCYFERFCPKPVETTTNSTDAKPVNFELRTIEKLLCSFWSIPSSFLINFRILKALQFCVYFWLKSSDEAGGGDRERAKQCHRSQCIIASQRTSQSNCLLYNYTYIITGFGASHSLELISWEGIWKF